MTAMAKQNNPSQEAALIFCDRMLNEIREENAKLKADNARLQPVYDYLQKLEIGLGVRSNGGLFTSYIGDGEGRHEEVHGQTVLTKLENGSLKEQGDDSEWVIPIDAYSQPLANFGFAGGIFIKLANRSLNKGFAQARLGKILNHSIVLEIFVADHVVVRGTLDGLSVEGQTELKNGEISNRDITEYLWGRGNFIVHALDASFSPSEVVVKMNAEERGTLEVLGLLSPKCGGSNQLPNCDEMQYLTVSALGGDNHKNILKEYERLKQKNSALKRAKDSLTTINISHDGGSFNMSIEEGVLTQNGARHLFPDESSDPTLVLDDVKSLKVSWMGMDMDYDCSSFWRPLSRLRPSLRVMIPYPCNIFVFGYFQWEDYDEAEIDLFEDMLVRAGWPNQERRQKFPRTYKMKLEFVSIEYVEEVLKIVAIETNTDVEATD